MGGVVWVIANLAAMTGKFNRLTSAELDAGLVESALDTIGSDKFAREKPSDSKEAYEK